MPKAKILIDPVAVSIYIDRKEKNDLLVFAKTQGISLSGFALEAMRMHKKLLIKNKA